MKKTFIFAISVLTITLSFNAEASRLHYAKKSTKGEIRKPAAASLGIHQGDSLVQRQEVQETLVGSNLATRERPLTW